MTHCFKTHDVAVVGEIPFTVGASGAALIVKVSAPEVPPPGAGLTTVTVAPPCVATSAAGTCAVNSATFTNVVASAVDPHITVDSVVKVTPIAVTVSGNVALPAVTLVGEMLLIIGTTAETVNVSALDVPPPGAGVTTVTEAVPSVFSSAAGNSADSPVLLW